MRVPFNARGQSLTAGDEGHIHFKFAKRCPVYLWVHYWCIISIFFEFLIRNFHNVSAGVNFSPKYCSKFVEKAMKPLVFMYHEAMSISLGSKNFLKLVSLSIFPKCSVQGR